MVAFLIAALALGVILHTTTAAVLAARVAGQTDEAVARADSHLASLRAAPLIDSDRQGDDGGGYHWRLRVASAGSVAPARSLTAIPPGTVTLYRITVTISWTEDGRRRAVQLESAQLGPVA